MSIVAIHKHRFWPTGTHKFNTNDVIQTVKIDENYTDVHLQGRSQALTVAMPRTELQNLIIKENIKNNTFGCEQSVQDTHPAPQKDSPQNTQRRIRRIHRRR